MSAQDLEEMRNECKIEVMTYESLFEFNYETVRLIEQNLILKLLNLIDTSHYFPKMQSQLYKVVGGNAVSEENSGRACITILKALN